MDPWRGWGPRWEGFAAKKQRWCLWTSSPEPAGRDAEYSKCEDAMIHMSVQVFRVVAKPKKTDSFGQKTAERPALHFY